MEKSEWQMRTFCPARVPSLSLTPDPSSLRFCDLASRGAACPHGTGRRLPSGTGG